MRDLTVVEVLDDLQVAKEVLTAAVDYGNPLLTQLQLVIIGENEGTDGRIDVTAGVPHNYAQLLKLTTLLDALGGHMQPVSEP